MGFPRQEYWSGLPFPSPGDLPDQGIESMSFASPALQADSLRLSHLGSLENHVIEGQTFDTTVTYDDLEDRSHVYGACCSGGHSWREPK